jgi:hypothetical protein
MANWQDQARPEQCNMFLTVIKEHTTRNMLTCDPSYWSLYGHCLPFMTLPWPKIVGRQLSVTDGSQRPLFLNGRRRLRPKLTVIDSTTKKLVKANLVYPRQILRGQSYVADLWPSQMVVFPKQPNPVRCFEWAKPNSSMPNGSTSQMGRSCHVLSQSHVLQISVCQ